MAVQVRPEQVLAFVQRPNDTPNRPASSVTKVRAQMTRRLETEVLRPLLDAGPDERAVLQAFAHRRERFIELLVTIGTLTEQASHRRNEEFSELFSHVGDEDWVDALDRGFRKFSNAFKMMMVALATDERSDVRSTGPTEARFRLDASRAVYLSAHIETCFLLVLATRATDRPEWMQEARWLPRALLRSSSKCVQWARLALVAARELDASDPADEDDSVTLPSEEDALLEEEAHRFASDFEL